MSRVEVVPVVSNARRGDVVELVRQEGGFVHLYLPDPASGPRYNSRPKAASPCSASAPAQQCKKKLDPFVLINALKYTRTNRLSSGMHRAANAVTCLQHVSRDIMNHIAIVFVA